MLVAEADCFTGAQQLGKRDKVSEMMSLSVPTSMTEDRLRDPWLNAEDIES